MEIFQKRLNKLLKEKGITLQKLADEIQTTKVSISRYKNGHRVPDIVILYKIAKYFNISADWIIGLTDMKKPSWYDELPEELQKFINKHGIDYFRSAKYAKEKGIPPQDIKNIIETFEEIKPLVDKINKN